MKSIPGESANYRNSSVLPSTVGFPNLPFDGAKSCTTPDTHLSPAIAPHALYRHQLLNSFLCHYIPASQLAFGPPEERSWLVLLSELPTPTKALEISTLALCTAKLGRENDDPVFVKESLCLYTQGLCEMQKALWDPQLMYRDETLGACMALAMYELHECPAANRRAYASHQDGCAKLVELRGAEAHSSGLGHEIFLTFRRQSVRFTPPLATLDSDLSFSKILQALERHQSTYLSTPAWTSKPWATQSKRPFDRVFDFFALAPEIFKQADRLKDLNPHDALHQILEIVDQCWKIDTELERFYIELEGSTLDPLYWAKLSRETNPADDAKLGKVFPVAFHFRNLKMAGTLMFYWATLLMLWSGLFHLYQAISNLDLNCQAIDCCCVSFKDKTHNSGNSYIRNFNMSQLPQLDHRSDFASMAWKICQSVEYCMHESMLGLGPALVAAPLQIVIDTLKEHPGYGREVSWAKSALARVTGRGLRILRY